MVRVRDRIGVRYWQGGVVLMVGSGSVQSAACAVYVCMCVCVYMYTHVHMHYACMMYVYDVCV